MSDLTTPRAALTPEGVQRWGQTALRGGLALALALTLVAAWLAPELALLFPIAVVSPPLVLWLLRRPLLSLGVAVFGLAAIIVSDPGFSPAEVAYGLYLLTYLAHWYGTRLLHRERFVFGAVDAAFAVLLTLGIGLGIGLGLLFGAPLYEIRADLTGFGMLAFYFPVKEACRTDRRAVTVLYVTLAWLGGYIAVRHFLHFREILMAATVEWQVADARPGYNALQLMVTSLGALALAVSVPRMRHVLALLGLFALCFSALILIKYRGFWVAFLLGLLLLLVLLEGGSRRRLITYGLTGAAAISAFALVFFGEAVDLLLSGTLSRLGTLATAFTQDISLINRFVEAEAVLDRIASNPVVGYGFGTRYTYFHIIGAVSGPFHHIHIGYVGLWFRLGLWGVIALGVGWFGAAWAGWRVYRVGARTGLPPLHRTAALIASVSLLAMTLSVITESPWFMINQMVEFAILAGVAMGLRQRSLGQAGAWPSA